MNESVNDIAERVGGTVIGDGTVRVTGFGGLKEASDGDLSFLADPRYAPFLSTTRAAAVLVSSDCAEANKTTIRVADPYGAFATVLKDYEARTLIHPKGIHSSAVVGESVTLGKNVALDAHVRIADECTIGDNVVIYAGAYIGRGTTIGDDTIIYPNVSIRERVTVGRRCIIHSGVGIGGDGFGFASSNGTHQKIPQIGTVVIGDDVEIGSNATIDRATSGSTVIGTGTKIDNQVVIGHNVRIGEHCTISGNTGLAGSAVLGDHVTIGGMSAINGHIEIEDNVMIGGFSAVMKPVKSGSIVSGYPARDHTVTKRLILTGHKLPEALKQIRALEKRIQQLEEGENG